MKRTIAGFGALLLLALPAVARAHNAGHIILPDGTCLEIGSFHNAPIVGKDRTQLDLAPETPNPPFDEIGVSFVGHLGKTPILPGPCGVAASPMSSTTSQTSMKDNSRTQTPPRNALASGPFHSSMKRSRRSRGSAGY